MTDPTDPLGRIANHAAQSYDHPAVGVATMERYWRDHFAPWARGLMHGDLHLERAEAVADVAALEQELRDDRPRQTSDFVRRDRMLTRLARLTGKRDALAAEMERRSG